MVIVVGNFVEFGVSKMAIRPVTLSDLPQLKVLIDANDLFPSEMLDSMTTKYFDASTDMPSAEERWITYAGEDEIAQAVAYYKPEYMTSGTWNVLLLAVSPNLHGQGIGKQLMDYIEIQLKAESQRIIIVETSGLPDFEKTRGFYSKKCGYVQEAVIREFYDAGEDKIIFRKAL